MFLKHNPLLGIALFFEPHEIEDGLLLIETLANGFSQMEEAKGLAEQLKTAAKTIRCREKGYFPTKLS